MRVYTWRGEGELVEATPFCQYTEGGYTPCRLKIDKTLIPFTHTPLTFMPYPSSFSKVCNPRTL